MFATSTLHTGQLGGLAGADAICWQRAAAAGLTGTYKAWLSDASEAPATRFIRNPGRYVRTDGLPIAASWTALVSGPLSVPIDRDEAGRYLAEEREAWTNTTISGAPVETNQNTLCHGWDSASAWSVGRVGETDELSDKWTSSHVDSCDTLWRLYCFQQQ